MNVVMAGILIVVWQIFSYLLVTLFTGVDETYHIFLVKTIPWRIIAGIFFYSIIILIYYLAIHISKLREKAENEIRLNRIIKDSELNLLKSQINPHFLFNSLNSVNSLILINPTAAQEMIVGLSEFLRYSVLSNHQEYMSLQQEIENVKRYLSIEKIRFGNKLSFSFDIAPETLDVKLPAMVLQPLFENAIKHGVYESIQAVNIQTKTEKKGNHILIEVVNDFDPENIPSRKGSGTGLKNIRERLRLLYGRNAFLHTQKNIERFHAFIQIPVQK
jgi:LytS/YehU family sensor histidine kinase